jgi:hypothetical protein
MDPGCKTMASVALKTNCALGAEVGTLVVMVSLLCRIAWDISRGAAVLAL